MLPYRILRNYGVYSIDWFGCTLKAIYAYLGITIWDQLFFRARKKIKAFEERIIRQRELSDLTEERRQLMSDMGPRYLMNPHCNQQRIQLLSIESRLAQLGA